MRAFTLKEGRNLIFYFNESDYLLKDDYFKDLDTTDKNLSRDDMMFYSNPVEYNNKIFILGKYSVNVIVDEGDNYSHENVGVNKL